MVSASQIAHKLKVYGNGSEYDGVVNVFKTGVGVGVGITLLTGTALYLSKRFVDWASDRVKKRPVASTERVVTTKD